MSKYDSLSLYLAKSAANSQHKVSLPLSKIENILQFRLPQSASKYRTWWTNNKTHPQARAWLDVGWKVSHIDLAKGIVTMIHEVNFVVNKVSDEAGESCLEVICSPIDFKLVLRGSKFWASCPFSWNQLTQVLIDIDPDMFGILDEPLHSIFPQTLAKFGYYVTNWRNGTCWRPSSSDEFREVVDLDLLDISLEDLK